MPYNSEKITAAIDMIVKKGRGNTEDYVTRYVMMILQDYFDFSNIWSMMPQIRTPIGKFPDLALERFRTHGTKHFVPSVWIEFKSSVNMSAPEAVKQLVNSIKIKGGDFFSRWGYLIGIQGTSWLFMEYNVVITEEKGEIVLDIHTYPFNDNDPRLGKVEGRPQITAARYTEHDTDTGKGFELNAVKDQHNIIQILNWINKGNRPRNLLPLSETK